MRIGVAGGVIIDKCQHALMGVLYQQAAHIDLTENVCKYHTLQEILHPNLHTTEELSYEFS